MKSQKVCWIRLKVHILPVHRPWQYWNYRKWEFKMMDNFSSFCNSTSLHGWPHVPGAKTLERLFWLLTIALMVVLAASFCSRYRKGYPFPQVLSSCLWKWAFIGKKNFHQIALLIRTNEFSISVLWPSSKHQRCQRVWPPQQSLSPKRSFPRLLSATNISSGKTLIIYLAKKRLILECARR